MSDKNEETTIQTRLAENSAEIEAAQRLRYAVFYEEYKAKPSAEIAATRRDFDNFDPIADHLIVMDSKLGKGPDSIVGTYRLIRQERADQHGQFYSEDEYDLSALREDKNKNMMELGRSCVLPEYRTRAVLQLLWQGIADYTAEHDIDFLFGCGSFHGTNIEEKSEALSYLYHYHLAPEALRAKALDSRYVNMNRMDKSDIDAKRALKALPSLLKGYLRIGAHVGDGAVIDHDFNTVDVCIILKTALITERYRKHYERTANINFDEAS